MAKKRHKIKKLKTSKNFPKYPIKNNKTICKTYTKERMQTVSVKKQT